MARKRYFLAASLALAAIAPAALVGCGGSPATPTIGASTTPGATSPVTGTVGMAPTPLPTEPGNVPVPQGTAVAPAAVPSVQP